MDKIISISYKRFLEKFAQDFIDQYIDDVISTFSKSESMTFREYLKDIDFKYRVEDEMKHNLIDIAKDLGLDYVATLSLESDKDFLNRVYTDCRDMVKKKVFDYISDTIYFQLADRIN
ncbi:hypothetical protein [Brevibacillus sp. NRS-1366]|uniref:hypothetical protein n=1 Tax=Brevibacillus sp. NRS-1366 TaxID=3233899 RepID=UPI003D1D3CDE